MEAGKLLKSGLENGDIAPNDPPKTIWEANPIFQQYKLQKICAALNKMKSKMGCMIQKKRSTELNMAVEDCKPFSSDCTVGVGRSHIVDFDDSIDGNGWMPIYTIFNWCDSQIWDRITILIVMPTGVNSRYTVAVSGGGTTLELVVE